MHLGSYRIFREKKTLDIATLLGKFCFLHKARLFLLLGARIRRRPEFRTGKKKNSKIQMLEKKKIFFLF